MLSLCLIMPAKVYTNKTQRKNICKYENTIRKEAKANHIDPKLLASLIYVESGFHPHVVSRANACGLTQVIPKYTGGPETSRVKYTCKQLKNPKTSIKVGAKVLRYVIVNYANGNVEKGLCYYNAGNICLRKKGFYKRSRYVKKVMEIYNFIVNR